MIKITENVFLVNSEEDYKAVVQDMYGLTVSIDMPAAYPCIVTPTVYYNKVTPNDASAVDVYHAITGGGTPYERCAIRDGQVTWEQVKVHELREGDIYRQPLDTSLPIFRVVKWSRIMGRNELFSEQLPSSRDSFILELEPLPEPHMRKFNWKITFNNF